MKTLANHHGILYLQGQGAGSYELIATDRLYAFVQAQGQALDYEWTWNGYRADLHPDLVRNST